MCQSCWETEYGAAQIDTPTVRTAAALVGRVYEFSMVGGGLHAIVDDWNIEDEHVADDRFATLDDQPEQAAVESELLALFRTMTLAERASALALHDAFWQPA